jgi:hypothetical protein
MTQDDAAARKAQAKRLRKQIRDLTGSDGEEEKAPEDENETPQGGAAGESPRDFINRRMRQLEEDE